MTTDEKVVDINGQNNAFVLSRNLNPKSKHFINYIHLDTAFTKKISFYTKKIRFYGNESHYNII